MSFFTARMLGHSTVAEHFVRAAAVDLSQEPALTPPDGVTSNLVDPPNQNALVITVVFLCLAISTFLVLIRAYAKLFILKTIRLEDCKSKPSRAPLLLEFAGTYISPGYLFL